MQVIKNKNVLSKNNTFFMKQFFPFEKKELVFIFLLLFFIGDTVYSFYQHSLPPIDGDIPTLVMPSDAYQQAAHDPFGLQILQTGENCAGSNRFFMQWANAAYFLHVPLWFQSFTSPIHSVYLSMAVAKTLIQVGLILLLASYIRVTFGWGRNEWMLAAVIICPLFQAVGFFEYLAMIDNSTSYTFCYALFTLLLMLFLFPYYRAAITGDSGLPVWIQPLWLVFPIVLSFSGPLVGPVLLILCPATLLYLFYNHWQTHPTLAFAQRFIQSLLSINKKLLLSFGFTTLLCLYSFYIGTHNSENYWEVISLTERYKRLFEGLIKITSFSEGIFPIVLAIGCNLFILNRSKSIEVEKLFTLFYFTFVFALVYIFLLPVGGYRSYRPFIVRRDTLQPVLWLLFFSWGMSTVYILKHARSLRRLLYALVIASFCFIYLYVDKVPTHTNVCEKQSLEILASSKEDCVELTESCTVLQWSNSSQCEDTRYAAELLHLWNITPRVIHYKHKP